MKQKERRNSMDDKALMKCRRCGEKKPLQKEFWLFSKKKGEFITHACRKCLNKRGAELREKNKDKYREYYQKSKKKNKEKIKKYYNENKEIYKNWRIKNKKRVKFLNKRWQENNKEYVLEQNKKFRKENPERVKNWRRTIRKTLPDYYIRSIIKSNNPEAIKLKREQLMLFREIKSLKKEINDGTLGNGNL